MSQVRPSPATARTALLHRMLVIRHLAECHARAPWAGAELVFRAGEEAVAAGLCAALDPADVLVRDRPPREPVPADGVVVSLVHDGESPCLTGTRHLVCREHDHRVSPAPMVDGCDVELVLATARSGLRAARLDGTHVLDLLAGDAATARDPVAVLAARMYADRQLDHAALRAIDADAARHVAMLTGTA